MVGVGYQHGIDSISTRDKVTHDIYFTYFNAPNKPLTPLPMANILSATKVF
jgi:hypothetical protein